MKKCWLLLPVLLAWGSFASAQITINNTDMPVAGDTIRLSTGVAFTGMDEELTGPGYTWDFSRFTSLTQTIDTFLSVSSTDPVYAVYFANVSFNKNRANVAKKGMSFNPGFGFSVDEVFDFYYSSPARYEQAGFGAAVNGLTIPTAFNPHDTIYHFPLNYGNVDSSDSKFAVNIPNLIYYSSKKFRHNEADGWGSLTTPYGTFDVLRVKTVINEFDSLYIDTLGFGFGFNVPQQVQYKWLGKDQGQPLLQINTTGGVVTQILYRDCIRGPINIGVADISPLTIGPLVYPNPSDKVQTIVYSLNEAADVKLEVFTLTGEKIITLANERQSAQKHIYTLNVADQKLSAGVYLLTLTVNNKTYQHKLLVSR